MNRYRHDGPDGRVHMGLSVAAGIVLRVDTVDGRALPDGSTVSLNRGDVLVTSEPYEHAELTVLEPETVEKPLAVEGRRSPRVPAQAAPVD